MVSHDGTRHAARIDHITALALRESQRLTECMGDICWKVQNTGESVHVDIVDIAQYYAPFHDGHMIDTRLPIQSLNLPTLLVVKMISPLQRNYYEGNEASTRRKQLTDIADFDFALTQCLARQHKLTAHHLRLWGDDLGVMFEIVHGFAKLRRRLSATRDDSHASAWVELWSQLIYSSGMSDVLAVAAKL